MGLNLHKEYEYFVVFVTNTKPLCSNDDSLNMLQIQNMIMEIVETILNKPLATDLIRIKCADLVAVLFHFCHTAHVITVTQPSVDQTKYRITIKEAAVKLLTIGQILAQQYAKTRLVGHDQEIWHILETQMNYLSELLWNIASMSDLHELLSFKIQIYSHSHIIMDKMHAILNKPHMEEEFETKSIYPWKYYWHPKSKKLLNYLGQCKSVPLGVSYSLNEILKFVNSDMIHKIYDHETPETDVVNEMASIFQLSGTDFCLRDLRSLQWPLLQHLYTLKFEDLWNSKHLEVPVRTRVIRELSGIIKDIHNQKQDGRVSTGIGSHSNNGSSTRYETIKRDNQTREPEQDTRDEGTENSRDPSRKFVFRKRTRSNSE